MTSRTHSNSTEYLFYKTGTNKGLLVSEISFEQRREALLAGMALSQEDILAAQEKMKQMAKTSATVFATKAKSLAASMGHSYFTVEHLLAVVFENQQPFLEEIIGFLEEHTPKGSNIDPVLPTCGFVRVMEKLESGKRLVDAVHEEGNDSWGAYFLTKHNLS